MARAVGFFVLGFVVAYAIYLAGGLDWLQAYLASRPPDYASAVIPPPPPISSPATGIVTEPPPPTGIVTQTPSYPTQSEPGCTNGAAPPGCVIGEDQDQAGVDTQGDSAQTDEDTQDEGTQEAENENEGSPSDNEGPPEDESDQDIQNSSPPPSITASAPEGRGHRAPLVVRLSDGEQYAVAPGCSPAFTVINDTRHLILVQTGRRHHHWRHDDDRDDWRDRHHDRGDRDRRHGKVKVWPGRRKTVCVNDRPSDFGFDYYNPHPDADVPPEEDEYVARTVKIRLKDR